jgi:tripartite-type tricarboxylate transporter receptor subunit TctC
MNSVWKTIGLASCGAILATAAMADVGEFYKDRTVTLVISTGAGGGYDATARVVARYLPKHLPGAPTIVAKNMPGAGNVLAANYMYNVAPKDGTVIATLAQAVFLLQPLGGQGIKFDANKFYYLGSASVDNSTIYAWHTVGVNSIDDVYKKELLVGATGVGSGSTVYPLIMNNLLGTKFKIIAGYKTTQELDLAMSRGEVEGRAGNNFQSLKANRPDWIAEKKVIFIAQIGLERDSEYPDVPLLTELAKNEEQRRIFAMFSAPVAIGRPFLTTPGVPQDRAEALRAAFAKVVADPGFLAEGQKANLDIKPTPGAKLAEIVADLINTPPEIIAKAKAASDESAIDKPAGQK